MPFAVRYQVVILTKRICGRNKAGYDVKIPVLTAQIERNGLLITPDFSLCVLRNTLQSALKGVQDPYRTNGVFSRR